MTRRKRPPLSSNRQSYVDDRTAGRVVGEPLHYPMSVAAKYERELDKLISAMRRAYEREVSALWIETPPITLDASLPSQARIALNKLNASFEALFRKRAPEIVDGMLSGVDKHSASSLQMSLKKLSGGLTLKTSTMTAALKESIKASSIENVALIKSVATQYHERVQGAVMRSIQQGGEGRKTILAELRDIGGMSTRRAKIIADDQTRKVTTALNTARATDLGIRKFKWMHSGGGVDQRKLHVEASGKIFDYDDPPAIGDRGEPVLPGQGISCRCFAVPVLEWGQQ